MDTIDEKMKEQGANVYEGGQKQEDTAQAEPNEQTQQQAPEQNQQEPQKQEAPKQDDTGQEKPEEGQPSQEEQNKIDWLKSFNERFETNYESEDQVKELFDYKTKYGDLQEAVKTKDEALSQASDPTSYFADESIMKINEVVKQHKVDPSTASRIVNNDYSQMNSEDILVEQRLMEEPEWRGSEDLLREEIQEQYNLDKNPDDFDEDQQAKIKQKVERGKKKMEVAAQKAKKQFEQMQQVELPQKQDLEGSVAEKKEQLKQSAEKNADKMVKDLEKINYHDDLEFQIDEDWKNKYFTKDNIVEYAKNNNLDLSDEETYKQAVDQLKKGYIAHNLGKIMNDYKKKIQTDQKDKEYQEYNNPRGNNRQQAPSGNNSQSNRDKVNEQIKQDKGI